MFEKQIDINEQLVRESLKGSMKAQRQLYDAYASAMYYTCYTMMRNREEAEDMLQESFSEAFTQLHRFKFDSTFGTWLKRIVVNKCINEIKRKKTDLTFAEDMGAFEDNYTDAVAVTGLSVDKIKKAMEKLPEGSRIVFSSTYWKGMTIAK